MPTSHTVGTKIPEEFSALGQESDAAVIAITLPRLQIVLCVPQCLCR
ncbi:MAG: hypothetical protein ACTXOO_05865 [Sodalis sp. (in: enterobacteria)]